MTPDASEITDTLTTVVSDVARRLGLATNSLNYEGKGLMDAETESFLVDMHREALFGPLLKELEQAFQTYPTIPEALQATIAEPEFPAFIEFLILAELCGSDTILASGDSAHNVGLLLSERVLGGCEPAVEQIAALLMRHVASSVDLDADYDRWLAITRLHRITATLTMTDPRRERQLMELLDLYERRVQDAEIFFWPAEQEDDDTHRFDALFVEPALEAQSASEIGAPRLIDVHRAVVLGDPGGGKSTLVKRLLLQLTRKAKEHVYDTQTVRLLPVIVVLREYQKTADHLSVGFSEYIGRVLRQRYELPGATRRLVEYALATGRIVVMFDGLDELIVSSARRQISKDIGVFAAAYPGSPIIVTSRRIGYDEAPLPREIFSHFALRQFDAERVELYARKWFTSRGEPEAGVERLVRSFMRDSASAPDLRSNPLMLALLCTLYKSEGTLPRTRPEIYGKCAEMMYIKWDQKRGVEGPKWPNLFESFLSPTVAHLALWVASNPEGRLAGVPEDLVRAQCLRFIKASLFKESDDKARYVADTLMSLFRGRAWVLTEVGLDPQDRALYAFAHQTFLEYFAAQKVASECDTERDLVSRLLEAGSDALHANISTMALQIWAGDRGGRGPTRVCLELSRAATSGSPKALRYCIEALALLLPRDDVARGMAEVLLDSSKADRLQSTAVAMLTRVREEMRVPIGTAVLNVVPRVPQPLAGELLTRVVSMEGPVYAVPAVTGFPPTEESVVFRLRDRAQIVLRTSLEGLDALGAVRMFLDPQYFDSRMEAEPESTLFWCSPHGGGVRAAVDSVIGIPGTFWGEAERDVEDVLSLAAQILSDAALRSGGLAAREELRPSRPRQSGFGFRESVFGRLAASRTALGDWLVVVLCLEELMAEDGPRAIFERHRTRRLGNWMERAQEDAIGWRLDSLKTFAYGTDRLKDEVDKAASLSEFASELYHISPRLKSLVYRTEPLVWLPSVVS